MGIKKTTQLKRQYKKCMDLNIELSSALQILSNIASKITGYDVVADLCHGSEIEFRKNGDASNCMSLEDIIEIGDNDK